MYFSSSLRVCAIGSRVRLLVAVYLNAVSAALVPCSRRLWPSL
ncbi:Uncharacterised protein [Mycobacteroides abscessus subsp. abscessus]|nr:Uncharacterised protein [Mycobacteroides abscessus subsp. abscessus]